MGNQVSTDENGNPCVDAYQEVNPIVFSIADDFTKTQGKMMMHEANGGL